MDPSSLYFSKAEPSLLNFWLFPVILLAPSAQNSRALIDLFYEESLSSLYLTYTPFKVLGIPLRARRA